MGPDPAVAELRSAVRCCLDDLAPGALVLAACSGGPDSLALAATLAFVAPRQGLRAGGVTVDHQLQPGSAAQAARVAAQLTGLGLDPVRIIPVAVAGPGGPEAAARTARYQALDDASQAAGAAAVLLGHTLDDQAETVLLGLARGSGGRSLAGMPARSGIYRRPLLAVGRGRTLAACAALGLDPWQDPHNADRRYTRVRVRLDALPALQAALGPGVTEALARTAGQLRADAEALDQLAAEAVTRLTAAAAEGAPATLVPSVGTGAGPGTETGHGMSIEALAALPPALRTRVLRIAAIQAGCAAGALTARHTGQLDQLITGWHGQRWIDLPGGIRGLRQCGKLRFSTGSSHDTEGADGHERHGSGPEGGPDLRRSAADAHRGAGRPDRR